MHPFKLAIVPVTPFEQNCSIIVCSRTNRAAVVDPGGDLPRIEAALAESGATLEKILLTHGHLDHIGAATELARKTGVAIEGPHIGDKPLLDNLPQIAAGYGLPKAEAVNSDRWLDDGDVVAVGDLKFDVLHCPGHSPGSVVFAAKARMRASRDWRSSATSCFAVRSAAPICLAAATRRLSA